jgi:hypothetical protein
VLLHLTKQLIHRYGDAPGIKVYADLEGYKVAGGTIPPHLLTTASRPDLVVSNAEKKELHVYELTCPFDAKENIAAARKRKLKRYQSLPRDVEAFGGGGGGWTVATLDCIEVCSLGSIGPVTKSVLQTLYPGKSVYRRLSQNLAKIAISTSYSVFLARSTQEWGDVPLIDIDVDKPHVST